MQRLAFTLAMVGLAVGAGSALAAQTPEQTLERLRAENRRLREENTQLRQQIEQLQADRPASTAPAAATGDRRVAELEAELAAARAQMDRHAEREAERYVHVRRDPATGAASIVTQPGRLRLTGGSADEHWVHFEVDQGKGGKVERSQMILRAFFSGSDYRGVDELTLHIDGEAVTCPIVSYERDARVTGGPKRRNDRSDEKVIAAVAFEVIERMAKAARVTGRISFVEFEFTMEQMRMFGALAGAVE